MLPGILSKLRRHGGALQRIDGAWSVAPQAAALLGSDERRELLARSAEIEALMAQEPDCFDWQPLGGNARALWFLHRVASASAAYHCTAVLSLRGDTDAARCLAALDALCQRHPMLRAQFGERIGEPCYRIADTHANEWLLPDAPADSDAAIAQLLAIADRPLLLDNGQVMRVACVRADGRLLVLLVVHHIVADFYSCEALARELVQTLQGQAVAAPAADYAQWLRENHDYEQSPRGHEALAYWKTLLQGAPATLDLPTDFARPALRGWSGERIDLELPPVLVRRVRELAADLKATPYTILLGAYLAWLRKLGGQDDFVVGTPTLGRHAARHRSMVGYLANPIAVRAPFAPAQSFAGLVAALKTQLGDSLRRQRYPLARLVEELHLPRRPDRAPLFQLFFTYSQARHDWGDAVDLDVVHMGMRGAAHELILTVFEDGERLRCQIGYSDALYQRGTALEWLQGYADLLACLLQQPDAALDALQWSDRASAREAGALLPRGKLHAIERIEATPAACIALLAGEDRLDYAALRAQARALAGALQHYDGEIIGLALPRGMAQIVAMVATWYAGRAWLALDMQLPAERLALMVEDSGARLVLGEGLRPSWLGAAVDWQAPAQLPPAELSRREHSPQDLAYLIYTSGSTGRPKGVAVSHGNLCTYVAGVLDRLSLADAAIFATLATVSADLGHTALFGALLGGRSLRLIDDALARDPQALAQHLQRYPIDVLKIVPSHLEALLCVDAAERLLPRQALVCGGEALPWVLVDRVGALVPHCRVFNHYGPTETTVGATCIDAALAPRGTSSVAIGTPLPHYRAYVLDENGRPLPAGVIGELYIGGGGVAPGYWQREDLTAERFVADPREATARAYRTGDRVQRLAGGEILFHGRVDDQVKIRGYRVEPGEIEQRLRVVPGVVQAVVLVVDNAAGARQLAAFWRGTAADPLAALRAALPDYLVPAYCVQVEEIPFTANGKADRAALRALLAEARPATVATAPLDAFEMRLAALWQPLFPGVELGPDDSFFALGGDSIAALKLAAQARRAGIELTPALLLETPGLRALAERVRPDASLRRRLCELYGEVLALAAVDANADFFALGGDSIGALKLVASARRRGIALTPLQVLEQRSVAALAALLAEASPVAAAISPTTAAFDLLDAASAAALRAARPQALDAYPLSPLQEGILFNALAAPEAGHYINQQILRLSGVLDRAALHAAWTALCQRHESLRLGFDWENTGAPLQWVLAAASELREHDWSQRDPATLADDVAALAAGESTQAFALDQAGLARLHLIVAGPQQAWLVLTLHHLVIDRWSAALLLDELVALYDGRTLPAPPRYRDYIAWLGAQPPGNDEAFWREQLADFSGGEELPPPTAGNAGIHLAQAHIDADGIAALRASAAQLQVPLTSLLQACWALLLSRYTNSPDVCFGLTVSGRPPALAGAENIAGLFINTLPMRVRIDGGAALAELCQQVFQRSFALQAHDRLPLAQIAALGGFSSVTALFRSLLVIENIPFASTATLRGGLTCTRERATSATHLPLLVQLTPQADGLHLLLQSQRAELDDALVERMLADWLRLLREFPQLLQTPAGEIGLVPAAQWNDWRAAGQGAAVPADTAATAASLAEIIEDMARRHPHEAALSGDGVTLSYAALNRAANQLAHRLRERGVAAGDRVALVADRSVAITVALLAVLKAGAAYVPLDPEYPAARIRFVLADAGCRIVLARGEACAVLGDFGGGVLDLDDAAERAAIESQSADDPVCELTADAAAYVIYTSGSTGQPKGVVVPHRGPLHLLGAVRQLLPAAPGDRVLQFTGLYFDMSVLEWLCAWSQGACLVLVERDVTRSGDDLLARLDTAAITHLIAQPAVLAPLQPAALPRLRYVLLAGDHCPDELAARWSQGRVFYNAYGPTEASVIVTADIYQPGRALSIGTPLAQAQCHVLDWSGQPCADGFVGELHLAGAYLASGYLGLADKTAAAFHTPASGVLAGTRLYASGDRVRRRADGRLEFLGRRDHQVKIRGLRIELGEIEAALREEAGVSEAVALVHRAGTDAACIVAFVQGHAAAADLRAALRQRLPPHLLPAHIECAAALPQTASRKVDRRALALLAAQVVQPAVAQAPATATEARLQQVWQTLFRREPIGVTADFFALGGHSLLATRLAGAIAQEFTLRLDLRRLFAASTIREQALLIDTLYATAASEHDAAVVIESGYL